MGGKKPHTYEEVKQRLSEYNYILISNEYVRHTDKLDMICNEGHECSISFKNFKNGKRCKKCSNKLRSIKQRTPFEEIKEFVKSCDAILISKEDDYVNNKSELEIICKNGHPFKSSVQSLRVTNCGCQKCRNGYLSEIKRIDGNVVLREFTERGLIPKFSSEFYINAHQKLPYLCKIHINEDIKYTTYDELLRSKFTCKSCYLENNQRENHWNWQGGISSLSEYLRIRLNEWKFESLKEYDFKCAISGIHSKDLEVHHLHNFSDIVNEVLSKLDLPVKKISEYTSEQVDDIESEFYNVHDSYGLGVPLTKDIHTLYHKKYKFKNNSPEEFAEFVERYKSGEFNNQLEEVV